MSTSLLLTLASSVQFDLSPEVFITSITSCQLIAAVHSAYVYTFCRRRRTP